MDLTTTYLGLNLRSPLVVGAAAPLTEDLDNLKRMEEAGAGAIALHSLFEEQIREERLELHHHLEYGTQSFAEALSYFPEPEIFHVGSAEYLEHIQKAKSLVNIPVFASLNGSTVGGWTHYAKEIEEAGADALECNIYSIPTDMNKTSAEVEQVYLDIVKAIKSEVKIPIAVKISPHFSNMANMAKRLVESGADGLIFFNSFYQPDIDINELKVTSNLLLNSPQAMRLPMRWIAILYGRLQVDFMATGGIQHGHDALKMLMAGASAMEIVGALLRHGIHHLKDIETEMVHWMEENEYHSVKQMQGSMSQINCADESQFERVQYMKAVQSYKPAQSLV